MPEHSSLGHFSTYLDGDGVVPFGEMVYFAYYYLERHMKEKFSKNDEPKVLFADRPSNSEVLSCMEKMQEAAADFREKIRKYHRVALANEGVDLSTKSLLEVEALEWGAVLMALDKERETTRERHIQALTMLKKRNMERK